MNRKLVLNSIISNLKQSQQILTNAQKESEKASQEAAPRMEARYDSRKEEMASLANAQSHQISENEKMVEYFQNLKNTKSTGTVSEGSLIEFSDGQLFLVSKFGGGLTVEIESRKVSVVSLQSLLGQQLLGKKVGDTIRVSSNNLEIRALSN